MQRHPNTKPVKSINGNITLASARLFADQVLPCILLRTYVLWVLAEV